MSRWWGVGITARWLEHRWASRNVRLGGNAGHNVTKVQLANRVDTVTRVVIKPVDRNCYRNGMVRDKWSSWSCQVLVCSDDNNIQIKTNRPLWPILLWKKGTAGPSENDVLLPPVSMYARDTHDALDEWTADFGSKWHLVLNESDER